MASVGEVKALAQEANIKLGEAWQALETAKESAAAALAATQDAQGSLGVAFDGTDDQDAGAALSLAVDAETEARAVIGRIEAAQDRMLASQNACEMFMSRLG